MAVDWIAVGTIGTLVGLAVAGVMAYLGFRQFSHQVGGLHKQLQIQVLLEYTRRYEEAMGRFPAALRRQGFHNVDPKEAKKESNLVPFLLYVNLCSEEFYLHKQGLIDAQAWEIWEREMRANLASPFGQEAWKHLKATGHYSSYGDFTRHVDAVQARTQTPAA